MVDVRDVADLHVRAMTHPAAKGERFLAVAGDSLSLRDVARVLKSRLGPAARKVRTFQPPSWLVRLAARRVEALRPMVPQLDRVRNATNAKAKRVLGWQPRSSEEAIAATGESLAQFMRSPRSVSQWSPAFPIERPEATFPNLTDEQLEAIEPFGETVEFPAGTCLYRRGERDVDFFAILSGKLDAFNVDRYGNRQVFVTLEARAFSGELNLFSNSRSLVSTVAVTPVRALRVRRKDLRRMITAQPDLGEILLRAFVLRRMIFIRLGRGGVTLIGHLQDADTTRIRQFLIRNSYPHELIAPDLRDGQDGKTPAGCLSLNPEDLPAVWDGKSLLLKNPSLPELSRELGLLEELPHGHVFDVAIVGAGPSGLAAAVYSSSEGHDTVLLDTLGPGGQAGTSSRIENYLGFPNGLSGQELASRAQIQAVKFGVHSSVGREVRGIRRAKDELFEIELCDKSQVRARAVIVASGATYRKLDVPECARFEGRGIHYAATAMESDLCHAEEVIVVGGGNSAGQAAVYLSRTCSTVHILVRSGNLSSSMSSYLIERIAASSRIRVHFNTEITELVGDRGLEAVRWTCDGGTQLLPIRTVFVMIGAVPNTGWLKGCLELDEKGFIRTGRSRAGAPLESPFETAQPGIFAVGDVRADSVKRVASAVGEGSVVLQWVQRYLSRARVGERREAA